MPSAQIRSRITNIMIYKPLRLVLFFINIRLLSRHSCDVKKKKRGLMQLWHLDRRSV